LRYTTIKTVLAINHKELPERGWHIFTGVLSPGAEMAVIALPISSIVVLGIVAGAWLVVIGTIKLRVPGRRAARSATNALGGSAAAS
jgi:uncharacterized membrane protein HdeD (DUF308 family)